MKFSNTVRPWDARQCYLIECKIFKKPCIGRLVLFSRCIVYLKYSCTKKSAKNVQKLVKTCKNVHLKYSFIKKTCKNVLYLFRLLLFKRKSYWSFEIQFGHLLFSYLLPTFTIESWQYFSDFFRKKGSKNRSYQKRRVPIFFHKKVICRKVAKYFSKFSTWKHP